jgi:hypothetical protein
LWYTALRIQVFARRVDAVQHKQDITEIEKRDAAVRG